MKTITLAQANGALHNPTKSATVGERERQLKEASRMFAGYFMAQVFKSMRETVKISDFGHGGMGEKFFQAEADEAMAMEAAKGEGYGLTELIYKSMRQRSGMKLDDVEAGLRKVRDYRDAAGYADNGVARNALQAGGQHE